ncbi:MAG: hypothetical protein M3O15_11540 [Acidobacteriota bacterium]|nr:hypothetical protein [Acidobacteriota bacterium]
MKRILRLGALSTLIAALGALVAVVCVSCRPSAEELANRDPLQSLRIAADSTDFDLAYWVQQERAHTRTWREAVLFCRTQANELHPNCRSVRLAGWWAAPPPPPIPPAGFRWNDLPTAARQP